jgi:hypothetical protein
MLRKHLAAIAAIDQNPALKYRVRRYFDLPRGSLFAALMDYSQADLVLCLVRIGTTRSRSIAESIIGKPITIGPACRFVYSFNKQTPSVRRQPVIVYVCPNPDLRHKSRLAVMYREFKVGRTKDQLLQRGVRMADIRRAERRGLVRIAQ